MLSPATTIRWVDERLQAGELIRLDTSTLLRQRLLQASGMVAAASALTPSIADDMAIAPQELAGWQEGQRCWLRHTPMEKRP